MSGSHQKKRTSARLKIASPPPTEEPNGELKSASNPLFTWNEARVGFTMKAYLPRVPSASRGEEPTIFPLQLTRS